MVYSSNIIFVGDISLSDTIEFTSIDEDSTPQFTLACNSTGRPATTVTWTRDSVTITAVTETTLDNSITAQYTHTLTMTGRLGGLYTCTVANNKPSNDSSSLRVKGKDNMCTHHTTQGLWKYRVHYIANAHAVASAPDSLSLKQDGETTVIVSWTVPTPPGDTTGYRVYYTTDNNMIEISIDTNSSPITLTSLEPLKEYNISVVGLSEHFSSEPITSSIFLGEFIKQQYTYIGSLSIAVELPRDVSVAVNSVTSTTISLSVSISNYDSNIPFTITVTWVETLLNPCSDETEISDHYMEDYIPTVEYNIMKNYADYNITVTITNAAGSVTSDTVNVITMREGKSYNIVQM